MKNYFVILYLLTLSYCSLGQNTKFKGIVTEKSSNPIFAVSVYSESSGKTVMTDIDGKFEIEAKLNTKLVFKYLGYQEKKVQITGDSILKIVLEQTEEEVSEVVVMSYESRKMSNDMGSMSSMKSVYMNPSVEEYSGINENGFKTTTSSPLSTFAIDVDRASYSNVRRFINLGQKPPQDAVRVEEMINYFEYEYESPKGNDPVSIYSEFADCPWQSKHKLLMVGLQAKKIPTDNLPPSNLVFLLDVSGSMSEENKLPLLKSAFKLLVNNLRSKDKVAIVVYAGAAGVVLQSTSGDQKSKIIDALEQLQAGGSTAGGEGIKLAYDIAIQNFVKDGNNRIILATDGDFNVGVSNNNDLETLIEEKRKSGVFLTCLGFGMGNYKDNKMETLADKGNGNYAYIDDIQEANKTLVTEFGGTLFTVAKDVKVQIEFNPNFVQAYRLVGYENRMLNNEDFKDDTKDGGEMGAGHTVTALYEIIPVGIKSDFVKSVDSLKYQTVQTTPNNESNGELCNVKIRYKQPDGSESKELVKPVKYQAKSISSAGNNFKFAASVAMTGMLLRNSDYKQTATYESVIKLASESKSFDPEGYRAEFIRMVKTLK